MDAAHLLSLYPALARLFTSGCSANVVALTGVLDEGVPVIQKLFSMKDLAAKVKEAMDDGERSADDGAVA